MSSLAHRVLVGVVPLLLASVGTASAECAWVLWEHRTGFGKTGPYAHWQVLGSWPVAVDCRREFDARFAAASRTMSALSYGEQIQQGIKPEDMKSDRVVVGDSITASSGLLVDGSFVSSTVRYVCLPDTVDPRGPKGK
jgi:hypothetical protein